MMHEEFEKIAGYEVSAKDYHDIIEPMYMAVNLSKEEFVKTIDKKRFALKPASSFVREMKKVATHLRETCDHYTDLEAQDNLQELCRSYLERRGWKGYAGFMVDTEMTVSKCFYPATVSFYGLKTYKNIEVISLA